MVERHPLQAWRETAGAVITINLLLVWIGEVVVSLLVFTVLMAEVVVLIKAICREGDNLRVKAVYLLVELVGFGMFLHLVLPLVTQLLLSPNSAPYSSLLGVAGVVLRVPVVYYIGRWVG